MELLNKFLKKSDFESYEDFQANFRLDIPEDFDFARDVVDFWAENEPDKLALLYCNDDEEEIFFTFSDISLISKKTAAYFKSLGIGKGDRVLLLLRRRWEYWVSVVALHRIGAVAIPASIQLTTKDLAYRINATKAKAVIAINDNFVLEQLYYMKELCNSLKTVIMVGGNSGTRKYNDFDKEMPRFEPDHSYSGLSNSDEMIIYATSATSGFPKMVSHNRTYPLGHIMTARFMQRVQNNGLHLTQSDSGWAKFGWGNIYGQWICGSAILAYDPERFHANKLMSVMEKFQPTSLCIPPTMYRFLLRDGLEKRHVESVKWFATAGEPLSGEVNKEFFDITGHYIHEGYGQSEGTPIACTFEWVDIRPASMGKPSPLYDVQIVRPDMTPCDVNENGEVVMKRLAQSEEDVIIAPGKQTPIIDMDTWERAKAYVARNPRVKHEHDLKNPYSGVLTCSKCGKVLTIHPYKHAEDRFECRNRPRCYMSTKVSELEDAILYALENAELPALQLKVKNKDGEATRIQQKIVKQLEKQLEEYHTQEEKQYELLETGRYSQDLFDRRNGALRAKIEETQSALYKARAVMPKNVDYAERVVSLQKAIEALKDPEMAPKDKNKLLRAIVERIEFTGSPTRIDSDGNKQRGFKKGHNPFSIKIFLRL